VTLDGAAVDEAGRVGDAGHISDVMVPEAGTPAADVDGLAVRCPGCGAYLGRVVARKGRPYLDDGRFLILTGMRSCHACRRWFHLNAIRLPQRGILQLGE
jgi:hypothetical protein